MSAALAFPLPDPEDERFRILAARLHARELAASGLRPALACAAAHLCASDARVNEVEPRAPTRLALALVPPAPATHGRALTTEERAAIERAARAVGRLHPNALEDSDRRADIRQALGVKLLTEDFDPQKLHAWLLRCARNSVASLARDEARHREILKGLHENGASGYRRKGAPSWYQPCEGAEQFAPFALNGARVMHCKPLEHCRDVEGAMVDAIDARAASGEGPARTPTCAQDRIAEAAIRENQKSTYHHHFFQGGDRIGASSFMRRGDREQ